MLWRVIWLLCLGALLASPLRAENLPENTTCPNAKEWRPTNKHPEQILTLHQQWLDEKVANRDRRQSFDEWAARNPEGRANLCNADLSMMDLHDRNFVGALLNNANLNQSDLRNARLTATELTSAQLQWTVLDGATLRYAILSNANMRNASVVGTELSNAQLWSAIYAPRSAGPNSYLAGIKGLATVTFPAGEEIGLVQLRDLLQKAGLRDLEREATFAIERGKTAHALEAWRDNLGGAAEAAARLAAFGWTTGYGLNPGFSLELIVALWAIMSFIYFWPIRLKPERLAAGIYQVWPADRIERTAWSVSVAKLPAVCRLQCGTPAALGYAAYFSLLSAFHIGWRDLNVGTWISRAQPREYALRAIGWVRFFSGIQSLLSVYFLAIWALTYFGRPFQ
jgi:hypothetical protein